MIKKVAVEARQIPPNRASTANQHKFKAMKFKKYLKIRTL